MTKLSLRATMTKPAMRSSSAMLLAGLGTLTFDQRLRKPKQQSAAEALAGDWSAIGQDLRQALRRESKAA